MDTQNQTNEILQDPSVSHWVKAALTSALARDCVDAANDAALVAHLLADRANKILASSSTNIALANAIKTAQP
jgi:hypothetical protein